MGIIKAGTTSHPAHPNARTTEAGPRGLYGYLTLNTIPQGEHVELQDSSCFMAGETYGPFFWLRVGKDETTATNNGVHLHHTDARALRDALNVALGDEK